MMNTKTAIGIGWLGLVAVGCGAKTMIGEVPDGSAPDDAAQVSLDPVGTMGHTCGGPQFPGDHPYDFPAGVAGVWTGYVEGGTLGLGSDAVGLTLDHAASGAAQIHIVYGVAQPPPPATSATDLPPGYPEGLGPDALIAGFSYLAHNVDWQAFGQQWRLRFLIDRAEPWASWCRLQPSYATPWTGGVEYGCLPNTGGGSTSTGADGGSECYIDDVSGHRAKSVSCAQLELCPGNFICGCDQCGCDMQGQPYDGIPSGPGTYDILFDTAAATASGGGIHLLPSTN